MHASIGPTGFGMTSWMYAMKIARSLFAVLLGAGLSGCEPHTQYLAPQQAQQRAAQLND
jgi:hypothetical protein